MTREVEAPMPQPRGSWFSIVTPDAIEPCSWQRAIMWQREENHSVGAFSHTTSFERTARIPISAGIAIAGYPKTTAYSPERMIFPVATPTEFIRQIVAAFDDTCQVSAQDPGYQNQESVSRGKTIPHTRFAREKNYWCDIHQRYG